MSTRYFFRQIFLILEKNYLTCNKSKIFEGSLNLQKILLQTDLKRSLPTKKKRDFSTHTSHTQTCTYNGKQSVVHRGPEREVRERSWSCQSKIRRKKKKFILKHFTQQTLSYVRPSNQILALSLQLKLIKISTSAIAVACDHPQLCLFTTNLLSLFVSRIIHFA